MKRGLGWWRPAPVTAVVMSVAWGLVGNLATNTVGWRWWPLSLWLAVALLLACAVAAELRRGKGGVADLAAERMDVATAALAKQVRA